jgi:hypothetical protein
VDVYIEDRLASHNHGYLIECKHWEHNVHQDVVHGFKTVMEGAGASTGFIVSKRGFQKGAYEVAQYTNLNLVTFEELQHLYGDEWLRKQEEKLDKYLTELRHIYTCHFKQSSNIPIMNNGVFTSNGLSSELCHYAHWVGGLILTISSISPINYIRPEPVQLAQDPAIL